MSESGKLDWHNLSQILLLCLVLFPISIGLGFKITPQEKLYNDWFGVLTPLCVYGFNGAIAGAVATLGTVWVSRSSRLRSWPLFLRVLLAIVISVGAYAIGVLCGLEHLMRQPAFTLP